MLVIDPEKRISASEALRHDWMIVNQKDKKINSKSLEKLAKFHVNYIIIIYNLELK